jgi:outer membrane protein TolC
LLAAKQLEVAEQADETAKSTMDDQDGSDGGLVVESDLLSAKVRLASREQELIRARNNLELARAQRNTAMGVAVDVAYEPATRVIESTRSAIVWGLLYRVLANGCVELTSPCPVPPRTLPAVYRK